MNLVLILLAILWIAIGYYSFYFWWSKDFTFTHGDRYFGLLVSFMGLFGWCFGYMEHSRDRYTFFGRDK